MAKVQKVYTREFKEQGVQLAQTSGKPIVQIARELGISDTRQLINGVRNWLSTAKMRFQAVAIKLSSKKKIVASNGSWNACNRSVIS